MAVFCLTRPTSVTWSHYICLVLKIVSEYDQEIPQSQTADKSVVQSVVVYPSLFGVCDRLSAIGCSLFYSILFLTLFKNKHFVQEIKQKLLLILHKPQK